jgi:hypothetical protein
MSAALRGCRHSQVIVTFAVPAGGHPASGSTTVRVSIRLLTRPAAHRETDLSLEADDYDLAAGMCSGAGPMPTCLAQSSANPVPVRNRNAGASASKATRRAGIASAYLRSFLAGCGCCGTRCRCRRLTTVLIPGALDKRDFPLQHGTGSGTGAISPHILELNSGSHGAVLDVGCGARSHHPIGCPARTAGVRAVDGPQPHKLRFARSDFFARRAARCGRPRVSQLAVRRPRCFPCVSLLAGSSEHVPRWVPAMISPEFVGQRSSRPGGAARDLGGTRSRYEPLGVGLGWRKGLTVLAAHRRDTAGRSTIPRSLTRARGLARGADFARRGYAARSQPAYNTWRRRADNPSGRFRKRVRAVRVRDPNR